MTTFRMQLQARSPAFIAGAFATLLLVTLLVSWPALTGPFLFDDFPNLRHLASLGGEQMTWRSLASYMAQYGLSPGRPLSMLSFVVNDYAWPSEPKAFKYTNLMLHLLVGIAAFGASRCLARLVMTQPRANLAALLTMAAWLLHPMQLTTSMLVVQRMTQLSALFVLFGIWAYASLAQRASGPMSAARAIAALGICTIFATFCKETGALAPLLAVIVNSTLLRRRIHELPPTTRYVLSYGASVPTALLFAALAANWDALTNYSYRDFTMGERLLTQGRVLVDYLWQILLPSIGGSGIYHDDFAVSRGLLDPWGTLPALLIICGLITAGVCLRVRHPLFAFGVLWFFGAHILESTVFPVEMYFEHRNYLPMLGPLFSVAAHTSMATRGKQVALCVLVATWITFSAWLTSVQAPIWGDAGKLSAIWSIEHPMSARGVQQRATYLLEARSGEQAADVLLDGYERGIRGEDFPLQALNVACTIRSSAIAERAWPSAISALRSGGHNTALLETIGKLRLNTQRGACPQVISADQWLELTTTLLANPNYGQGSSQNFIHVERAYYFQDRRDLNATMIELEAAWDANNDSRLARLIAATLASAGLYEEAKVWADRAVGASPSGLMDWLSDDGLKSRRLQKALSDALRARERES